MGSRTPGVGRPARVAAAPAPLARRVSNAVRSLVRRRVVDEPLDWVRFRLDTFPRSPRLSRLSSTGYHPLPWLGLDGAKRGEGSETRLHAILPIVHEVDAGSALDIGCGPGFFTLSLASRGIPTIGVEQDPVAYRTALYVIRKAGISNALILVADLDGSNVRLLPAADAVLCLSVWHHFVRSHGFDQATAMLEALWERTGKALFFDTGENEMPPSFGLPPMRPDARTWLARYLQETCEGARVGHLGMHQAFAPGGRRCDRNLFVLRRTHA